uniref:Uncharacterized protein n=1 Tax=Trichogramma kaykai TaxID=54128 RepID=A0ABD2XDI9_9HYME
MCCVKDWILGKNKENNKATTTITHLGYEYMRVYARKRRTDAGEKFLKKHRVPLESIVEIARRIVYAYISCNYTHTHTHTHIQKLHSHIADSSASHSAAGKVLVRACSCSAALPSFRALRVSPLDVRETRSCSAASNCYMLVLAEEVIAPLQRLATRCVVTYSNSEKGWRGARTLRSPADSASASSRGGGGGGELEKVFYDVNLKFQYNPRTAAATAGASRLSLSLSLGGSAGVANFTAEDHGIAAAARPRLYTALYYALPRGVYMVDIKQNAAHLYSVLCYSGIGN